MQAITIPLTGIAESINQDISSNPHQTAWCLRLIVKHVRRSVELTIETGALKELADEYDHKVQQLIHQEAVLREARKFLAAQSDEIIRLNGAADEIEKLRDETS